MENKWIKVLARFNLKAVKEMMDLVEENRKLKEHIKKLEKRIHKQRCALRDNWDTIEMRIRDKPTWQNRMWQCYAMKLMKEKNSR